MRTAAFLVLLAACNPTEARWEELDTVVDDPGKEDGDEEKACGDDVVADEACDGDWTTTLCTDDGGELWWCEDGTWTADK